MPAVDERFSSERSIGKDTIPSCNDRVSAINPDML